MVDQARVRLASSKDRRGPIRAVLVVTILFAAAQLLLMTHDRFLEWDEAVYVAEVSRYADPIGFSAHRARGITLLIAPVVQFTDSITAMRLYLIAISSAGFLGAFSVWCRSIRWAAPVAATLFGSSWLVLFYGSEAIPNLFSALAALGALGVAWVEPDFGPPARWRAALLATLVALVALFRPVDAVVLIACLGVAGLIAHRRAIRLIGVGAIGLLVGLVPWVVEAIARFGGPLQRLSLASEIVGGGLNNNVMEYLRLLDGPLSWPDLSGALNPWALGWLLALAGLGVYGFAGRQRESGSAGLVAFVSAAMFAAPYLIGAEAAAPRFMIPALACLGIAAGVGSTELAGRLGPGRAPVAVIAVLASLLVAWNIPTLIRLDSEESAGREIARSLGRSLREESGGVDCFFLGPRYPQISVASGCRGALLLQDHTVNQEKLDEAAATGVRVYVITNQPDTLEGLEGRWRCEGEQDVSSGPWRICALGGTPTFDAGHSALVLAPLGDRGDEA